MVAIVNTLLRVRLVATYLPLLFTLLAVVFVSDGLWIYGKAQLAQWLIQHSWQRSLAGEAVAKPWPWADTWPIARLQSSQHGVDLYVLQGAQGHALAFGPGYMQGSALLGGQGSSVIAGHRDSHFRFLQQLAKGDSLQLTLANGETKTYTVTSLRVVDSDQQRLALEHRQAEILLVTCYPFNAIAAGGSLRYVVRAAAPQTTTEQHHY
jgi:sortase A